MCAPLVAIAAIGTVASIGLGIASMSAQASAAQAQLNYQAAAQYQQMQMQQQAMQLQVNQQYQQLLQAQQFQQQQQQLAIQQAATANALQVQQAAADRNLQVMQANAQIVNQYNQQRQQVLNERMAIMARDQGDRTLYQNALTRLNAQVQNNNDAANKVYLAEQEKVEQARKEAAFEQQSILAKSIGLQGSILASGRTGQSVGLLLNDVERQAGFATAQEMAMLETKRQQSIINMDQGWLQAEGANNQAASNLPYNPPAPYLPPMPQTPQLIGLGITDNTGALHV